MQNALPDEKEIGCNALSEVPLGIEEQTFGNCRVGPFHPSQDIFEAVQVLYPREPGLDGETESAAVNPDPLLPE